MTREEVIAWLEDEKEYYETNLLPENDKGSTAYQMAIEALKREQQILNAGYQIKTVDFYIGYRLFRVKEITQ